MSAEDDYREAECYLETLDGPHVQPGVAYLLSRGIRKSQIAKQLGCSRQEVYRIARKLRKQALDSRKDNYYGA